MPVGSYKAKYVEKEEEAKDWWAVNQRENVDQCGIFGHILKRMHITCTGPEIRILATAQK